MAQTSSRPTGSRWPRRCEALPQSRPPVSLLALTAAPSPRARPASRVHHQLSISLRAPPTSSRFRLALVRPRRRRHHAASSSQRRRCTASHPSRDQSRRARTCPRDGPQRRNTGDQGRAAPTRKVPPSARRPTPRVRSLSLFRSAGPAQITLLTQSCDPHAGSPTTSSQPSSSCCTSTRSASCRSRSRRARPGCAATRARRPCLVDDGRRATARAAYGQRCVFLSLLSRSPRDAAELTDPILPGRSTARRTRRSASLSLLATASSPRPRHDDQNTPDHRLRTSST